MAVTQRKKRTRLRDFGLQSERLLWPTKGPGKFEQEIGVDQLEQRLMLTTVERAVRWSQANSIWPDTFGLACCAIEMMSIVSSRYDIARFGAEVFRSSPRQADLLIVSGRVSHKMAAPLRQIYDQMLEPKWVIAMGACASSAGMFNNYAVLQGVDKIVPVDIYVPGCPPRPEMLVEGIIRLQERIKAGVPPAYEVRGVAS
jgi:NADH-quinone oxidoreductase subunit B